VGEAGSSDARSQPGDDTMHGLMMDMPLMISSIIRHAAEYHGSTPIVARTIEGDLFRYDYRTAYTRIQRLAHAIERLGMIPGDRVGTLAWNSDRHLALYFGVSGTGAVLHTVNPRLYPEQIDYIINHAEDQVLFFDITFAPLVARSSRRCSRP
jgi:acyl-CoA synthetase (AMP-forming)/AMP-acid ligase II